MRMKRLLSAAVGAALVATAPLASSASAATADDHGDDVTAQSSTTAQDGLFAAADLDFRFARDRSLRQAAPTITSRIRATSKSTYKYGERIKIKGTVQVYAPTTQGSCRANTWCSVNASGDNIALLKKKAGARKFKVVDVRGPDSLGKFAFRTRSNGNAVYGLVYGGTTTVKPSTASKKIKGTRHPHVRVRDVGRKVYMSGNIAPGWGHKRVLVQRANRARGKFRTWAKPRTDRRGAFRISLPAPRTGKWHYRLVIPKNSKKFAEFKSGSWGVYRRYN
ncbi:hypothetical protein ASG90_10495 [Nocardioides sp. Soil797]|nr:hypothetical protein ASG90_10495 [Nocardioides sp. Soil797]